MSRPDDGLMWSVDSQDHMQHAWRVDSEGDATSLCSRYARRADLSP
jgi:hypothetical protein